MSKKFGATVPPGYFSFLRTTNSDTGLADRYCIHDVTCHYYEKSKKSGNIIEFEASSIKEMEEYLKKLNKLQGGIKRCKKCLKNDNP